MKRRDFLEIAAGLPIPKAIEAEDLSACVRGAPATAEIRKRCEDALRAELWRIDDAFRPGRFHLERWGYTVDSGGAISYEPGAPTTTGPRSSPTTILLERPPISPEARPPSPLGPGWPRRSTEWR